MNFMIWFAGNKWNLVFESGLLACQFSFSSYPCAQYKVEGGRRKVADGVELAFASCVCVLCTVDSRRKSTAGDFWREFFQLLFEDFFAVLIDSNSQRLSLEGGSFNFAASCVSHKSLDRQILLHSLPFPRI